MSNSKTPTEIDQYLCNNRHLNLKLSLSSVKVELEPCKCRFMVTLYNGYVIRSQSQWDNWEDAMERFKYYCKEAFEIENKSRK